MRATVVALLAVLSLALSGCGGGSVGAGPASSADLLKPGALVYLQAVSDSDSPQWEQAEDLLQRFPDGDRWIAKLKRELQSDRHVTWEGDIRPALGDVVDLAVYGEPGAAEPSVVALTNPSDPDKLLALVRKLNEGEDEPAVTRVVEGWVAISDSQVAIDAALKAGGESLEDEQTFTSAMDELPEDALLRVYADPAKALELFGSTNTEARDALKLLGLGDLDFAGGWAKAKDDGAEVAAVLHGQGANGLLGTGAPYKSLLLEKVPDDALAFATFRGDGIRKQIMELRANPLYAMALKDAERELGIDVFELASLFEGEVAVYARPGVPIPELTLLLDAEDPARARASAETVLRRIAGSAGAAVTEDGDVTTAVFDDVTVNLASVDGAVMLTTSKQGIADLTDPNADRLADSTRYTDALDAAGAPDEYTGLAYVDMAEAARLILGYAGVSGANVPSSVMRNLEPLKAFVAYGKKDGSVSTSLAFLEID